MGVRSLGNALSSFGYKFGRTGLEARYPPAPIPVLTATGGIISDYTAPGGIYRAHIFTSSGTFAVTSVGNLPTSVEYVVVAGGGAGGNRNGGGGGAGGYRSSVTGESTGGGGSLETALSVSATSYTVTIGAGGVGGEDIYYGGQPGGNSSISGPDITTVTSTGGGGGGGTNGSGAPGRNLQIPVDQVVVVVLQDYTFNRDGASGTANQGYGGDGWWTNQPLVGWWRWWCWWHWHILKHLQVVGLRTAIAGPNYPIGSPGPGPSTGGWLAGGAGCNGGPGGDGGAGGGGAGDGPNGNGLIHFLNLKWWWTGGGGAGSTYPTGGPFGYGGSGIVVVRYQIGAIHQVLEQKQLVDLLVSTVEKLFMRLHTLVHLQIHQVPHLSNDYVMVAGGAAGQTDAGGLVGGAGGVLTNIPGLTPISTAIPAVGTGGNALTVTIGAGGAGVSGPTNPTPSRPGADTTMYLDQDPSVLLL